MVDYTLTFEITPDGDKLEIHASKYGLEVLKKQIEYLIEKGKDHTHLMAPEEGDFIIYKLWKYLYRAKDLIISKYKI